MNRPTSSRGSSPCTDLRQPGSSFRVSRPRSTPRRPFLADDAKLITPEGAAKIGRLDPHLAFCRDGMATGRHRVVWAAPDGGGDLKLSVIDQ